MAVSALDHPWLGALVGDEDAAAVFASNVELNAMLAFESALAVSQAELGMIPEEAAAAIARGCASFQPDLEALKRGSAKDGVIVPDLVRQLREWVGDPHGADVHKGATSQDVIDTALALRLKDLRPRYVSRLDSVLAALTALEAADGGKTVRGYTRMQPARSVSVAHKIATWRAPLEDVADKVDAAFTRASALQLGGPLGDRTTFEGRGDELAAAMAKRLGLADPGRAWHTDRARLAELADFVARLAGSLGRMGADVAIMALAGDVRVKAGGGSSAIPGKSNPVSAEILETLAAFAAAQAAGMHRAMVHPTERSGAAWTLEWMILPPLLVAGAAALRHAGAILGNIAFVENSDS